jgi:hypothetical protein
LGRRRQERDAICSVGPGRKPRPKWESRPGGLPGRPRGISPRATDPDVNLSIHPARATQRRLPPSIKTRSSSGYPLTPPDVGDLLPLLHGHYPVSSLLRSSAPLIGASVLSASWVFHLCLFPSHHRPGSQVPYESPNKSHASYTPDPAWPVSRYLSCLSQDEVKALVLGVVFEVFDASAEDRLHSSLLSPHDVIFCHAF